MKKRNTLQQMHCFFTRAMLSSTILAAVLTQTSSGAEEPEKGLSVNIILGYQGTSSQYPDLQWIKQELEIDSIGGEQPMRDFYAGEIGLAVTGRFGKKVRLEPSFNLLLGLGGGTRPEMTDSISYHSGYDVVNRMYSNDGFFGFYLSTDLGVRTGIPINLGNWQLMPMVGLKWNLHKTSASEYLWASYYSITVPVGLCISHDGERWRIGAELFIDPAIWYATDWALEFIVAADHGEQVDLGKPAGFSGSIRFIRMLRRGGIEITPYFTSIHHGRSNVGSSTSRLLWLDETAHGKWFEPAGSTLRIGVKAGWFFAFGQKKRSESEDDENEDGEE